MMIESNNLNGLQIFIMFNSILYISIYQYTLVYIIVYIDLKIEMHLTENITE